MADPLSITASVLAIATAAVQSVRSLTETVSRYKGRDRTLQRLQSELQDVSSILDSLKEAILAEAAISALLEGPVGRCSKICQEFEQSMLSFGEKFKTGVRDWAKLEFMRGDINEFIDTISGYKSTIAVGLGIITLRAAEVSQETLKDYNDMIQDTVNGLNVHLQRVVEKLEDFPVSSLSAPGIDLTNEKEVTKQCLWICEDTKRYLESTRSSSVLEVPNAADDGHQDGFQAQLLARQALDEHQNSFADIIGLIRNRLEALVLESNSDDHKERSRLLDDISAAKQCLEICKVANEVSSQKIYRLGEVVADGNSDQVVANTLADLFDVKKAISKDHSAQLGGSMSGENLRFLAEKRYGSRFGAFAPKSDRSVRPTRGGNMEEENQSTSRQTADINAQYGPYSNALYAASLRGHEQVVKMLLDNGAEVNAQSGEYGNALQAASCKGEVKVVEMLLKAGADVNAQGGEYGNALQAASYKGEVKVVEMLLKAGADVNAQGGEYGNALQAASEGGHEAVVKLLVDLGVVINAKDNDGKTPLQWRIPSWIPDKVVPEMPTDSRTGANAESSDKTPEALAQALAHRDPSAVRQLLEYDFDSVAQDEYEWLHELIDVGHSWYEIAGLLLEEANDAPWIYFDPEDQPFQVLSSQSPTMTAQDSLQTTSLNSPWMSKRNDVRILIQRLCGLGGIVPASRSSHEWNGEVIFEGNFSTSYISHATSFQNAGVTHQSTVVSRLMRVLENLCKAIAVLQSANMCREDFTIARICVSPAVPRPSNVELKKVDIALVIALRIKLHRLSSSFSSGMLDLTEPLDIALEILRPLLPHNTAFPTKPHTTEESLHVCCLAAQFLCVGLVSFCQGHVGPIESVFTNHSQERSVLLGSRTLSENPWHLRPYIAVCLSKLTCLGQMVEGPLITFSMSNERPRGNMRMDNTVQEAPLDRVVTKLSQLGLDRFFADQSEHHVEATPHDILYTWGPGQPILSGEDESSLRAIRVGGAIIYKDEDASVFHWEAGSGPSELPNAYFHRQSNITVGALVTQNTTQCSFPWQTWRASCTLGYLGVEAERWDPNQRQLGLQAGPDHIAFQAMQVWTKVPAKLLKQYQLRQDDFDMVEFLGCYVGVQVSCCTGVARRISLQELLSDLIPKYYITHKGEAKWNSWNTRCNILTGLRSSDVREWLFDLRRHFAEDCDELFVIVHRILKVLEPTGLNRARTHIQIAWPKEGDFIRGIKVSCKDQHLWAQALADSEEGVTFAYMTTTCLLCLCLGSSCQQSEQGWKMRPKCLGTAVTRYQNELEQECQSGPWALQDGGLYHMWNEKRYIRMRANVIESQYRLIASESAIPSYMALRHFRGKRYRGKNLIRERHHPDDAAVDVLLLDKERGYDRQLA